MTTVKCERCGEPLLPVVAATVAMGGPAVCGPCIDRSNAAKAAIAGGLVPTAQISVLKTVDEHNAQKRQEREERERKARLTGVACPKCGGELEWVNVYGMIARYPPPTTSPAHCGPCNLTVELER